MHLSHQWSSHHLSPILPSLQPSLCSSHLPSLDCPSVTRLPSSPSFIDLPSFHSIYAHLYIPSPLLRLLLATSRRRHCAAHSVIFAFFVFSLFSHLLCLFLFTLRYTRPRFFLAFSLVISLSIISRPPSRDRHNVNYPSLCFDLNLTLDVASIRLPNPTRSTSIQTIRLPSTSAARLYRTFLRRSNTKHQTCPLSLSLRTTSSKSWNLDLQSRHCHAASQQSHLQPVDGVPRSLIAVVTRLALNHCRSPPPVISIQLGQNKPNAACPILFIPSPAFIRGIILV